MEKGFKLCCIAFFVVIIITICLEVERSQYESFIEGEVIAIEYRAGPWEHTEIYFKTYSETEITLSFEGHVEVGIGYVCRITYMSKLWHYYNIVTDVKVFSLTGGLN